MLSAATWSSKLTGTQSASLYSAHSLQQCRHLRLCMSSATVPPVVVQVPVSKPSNLFAQKFAVLSGTSSNMFVVGTHDRSFATHPCMVLPYAQSSLYYCCCLPPRPPPPNACRYLGLSQTWRKFFCVLSPREKVAGYPTDMQLLVFSKNGFDRVTSIWMTHAAPVEIPLKAAHGRACYELVNLCTHAYSAGYACCNIVCTCLISSQFIKS